MSALPQRHRTILRTAAVCAAVAAASLGPVSGAFAAGAAKGGGPTPADVARCTVTKKVPSILPVEGMYVEIINRPIPENGPEGPQAVLKDKDGNVVGGVNHHHPVNEEAGLKLTNLETGHARLWQRRSVGGVAFAPTDTFPLLPAGCPVHWGAGGGTYVRTVKLADGVSTAKVYRLGPGHYRAEGFADGYSFGSIEASADEPYAAGNLNGMFTALSSKGELVSWIAKARPSGSHNETLADGKTIARVTSIGNGYRADLVDRGGRTLATLAARDEVVPYSAIKIGSLWAVLETDGSITSHIAR
ncbi:hypothetical protein [Streptomyces rimosus]|uniref:hypothetical protein n=1 Tax=Streptomyces rimosus TaxID=1927 RepID=UPI0004C821A5|nr:hypothetical protein [Streptomyces rimosus]